MRSDRYLYNVNADAGIITSGRLHLDRLPTGDTGKFLKATGSGSSPYFESIAAEDVTVGGKTEDVAVAKAGGGTRMLHFQNSRYLGYTDS